MSSSARAICAVSRSTTRMAPCIVSDVGDRGPDVGAGRKAAAPADGSERRFTRGIPQKAATTLPPKVSPTKRRTSSDW